MASSLCVATLALAAREAGAQAHRPRPSSPPPPVSTAPAVSSAPIASAPAPAAAATHHASATAASGAAPTAEPGQTLISGAIDRPGYHRTRVEAEIFAGVGPGAWAWPWGGFVLSPGLRLSFPLTRNGPIASMNNDFRLVVGAQVYFSVTPIPYWWLSAPVTLQWNFYLSDQWSVLLEAGIAVDVFAYDLINCYDHPRLYCDRVFFHPAGAFGLRRHLSRSGAPGAPSISFRFTYPGGVQVALGF